MVFWDVASWNWVPCGQLGVSSAPDVLLLCLLGAYSISSCCLLVLVEGVHWALTVSYELKFMHISWIPYPFLIARLFLAFLFPCSFDTACCMVLVRLLLLFLISKALRSDVATWNMLQRSLGQEKGKRCIEEAHRCSHFPYTLKLLVLSFVFFLFSIKNSRPVLWCIPRAFLYCCGEVVTHVRPCVDIGFCVTELLFFHLFCCHLFEKKTRSSL